MTNRDSEREAIVDELLLDADAANGTNVDATEVDATDVGATSGVRQALLSLGSFANLAAPTPGAELSAMLAGPHDEVSKRRWRHKHRTAVVSVAVVAAMGLGVSGVAAASSGFTRNPSFIDELLGNVRPQPVAAPVLPIPDAPRISTEPALVVDPAAIPSTPAATSIPVPNDAAPTETAQAQAQAQEQAQAQGQDVLAAPDPAASHETPAAASPAQSGSTPGHATPGSATPNPATPGSTMPGNTTSGHVAPNLATPNPQAKPAPIKAEKQQSAKPDASLQGAGKPAPALPGSDAIKPGHVPPVLGKQLTGKQLTDEQLRVAADRWKQWLKHGDRR